MTKKQFICIAMVLVFGAIGVTGCSLMGNGKNIETNNLENVKNVETVMIKTEETTVELFYTGIIKPDESANYSFKSSGKIDSVLVEKGDYVKKGQILAKLNKEDVLIQYESSKNQFDLAKLDLQKAEEAYLFNKDNVENIKALHEVGALSDDQFKGAKMNLTNSELTASQAKSRVKMAEIELGYKAELLTQTELVSEIDGYVVSVNGKSGERINAGMPVVTVRNDKKIVTLGVSQKDIRKFEIGTEISIKYDGVNSTGRVSSIADIPDQMTRMYEVSLEIENQDMLIGSIVDVILNIGNEEGIWIPIESVLSSSVDYVYLIEDGTAFRKNIEIEKTKENKIMITGIDEGDELVIKGVRGLKNGKKVKVLNN